MDKSSSIENISEKINDTDITSYKILKAFCDNYSSILQVDTSSQITELEQLIDGILAKLEEICNVVESVRHESKDALFSTIPILHGKCEDLQPIFKQIDDLDEFISMVEKCVEDAEEKVNIAEMEVGGNHFKKMLKSVPKFLGGKKDLRQRDEPIFCKPPRSFKTDGHFGLKLPKTQLSGIQQ